MTGTNLQIVKVGDIVLIHDDTPRMQWRLAMIEEVIKGLDGLVRAARIRTSSGKTNRPLAKLFPLEVNASERQGIEGTFSSTEMDNNINDEADNTPPGYERATRDAATRARKVIKSWTNALSAAPEDVEN